MREIGGHLPPGPDGAAPAHGWRSEHYGSGGGERLEVLLPTLDAAGMTALAGRVRDAARDALRPMPLERILDALDAAAERMLDRDHPLRRRAEQLLPAVTGFDAESVRLGLGHTFRNLRAPQLRRVLAADFGDPGMLDGFRPNARGGLTRARGPGLLLHVWAGNVPGLPAWGLARALLLKSGSLGKASAAEPLLAGWFAAAIVEAEPALRGCLAVLCWRGGADPAEQAALDAADAVLAFGSDAAIRAVRDRLPAGTRFVGHGHRVGFALVSREALTPDRAPTAAALLARDVVRFEQQGCFAPQAVFVERGGAVDPAGFSRHLGAALAAAAARHPRRPPALAEAAALAAWRDAAAARAMADPARALLSAEDDGWRVSFGEAEPLRPTPLHRSVAVLALDSLEQAPALVAPLRGWLQTAGVAAPPRRLHRLAEALGEAGVTRVAALGSMTVPEAGWHNDGRFDLLDLVTLTEIDPAAEAQAEWLAPHAD